MTFIPPRMPEPLLQELYWPNKWKVIVCCIFLNCTQRKQVEPVAEVFFARFPNPQKLLDTPDADVSEIIKSLGFKNRRTERLKKFSKDFLQKTWSDPRELYGVGEYAARCYEMLFEGKFRDTPPDDHALNDYWWFAKTQKVF